MKGLSRYLALERNPSYRWVVMGMGFMAVFAAIGLGRFGYSAILPEMQNQLALSSQQAGSLASWNLAGYVILAVTGGALATGYGARRVVTAGLMVTAMGMLLTGISHGFVSASVGRLITGFGSGVVMVPSTALMSIWFGSDRRGLASGIVASGSSLGLVLSGPLVPRIIAHSGETGWRIAWYVFAAATVVIAFINLVVMRNRPAASVGLSASPRPALDWRRIVSSRYAWHLGSVYMLWGYAYMVYFVFFQKRLIHDLGFTSEEAGSLFLALGLTSLICGVVWGWTSDRIGRRETMVLLLLLEAIASALFAFWPTKLGLIVSAGVFGLTALSFIGLVGAACGDRFGAVLAPASLGFVTLFVGIGQAIGPVVAGRIGDAFSSFAHAYAMSAGVFVLAAVLAVSLSVPNVKPETSREPALQMGADNEWK